MMAASVPAGEAITSEHKEPANTRPLFGENVPKMRPAFGDTNLTRPVFGDEDDTLTRPVFGDRDGTLTRPIFPGLEK